MTATSESILVYRTADAIEARALAAHMAGVGIEARVLGESLQGAYAGIHVGGMNAAEVWIPAADRDAAELIISDWQDDRRAQAAERVQSGGEASSPTPARLQYSMAAMLWLMTAVAILAAATSLELMSYRDWPVGLFQLLMLTAVLKLIVKGSRQLFRWLRRCTRDLPDSK